MLNFNKKGQATESITWIVATLIIIFLIVSSIYFSAILGKNKSLNKEDIQFSSEFHERVEIKTFLAYEVNSQNKNDIDSWINEEILE